ncbi:septum site-determining protein MinD [bacterium endosymbiont of Pedicinus badii]|uniref:septum site-determining protein MinD n=1 Tax=bacterium endosymbiont of Pedicinus badii TaxID=1719126 RepID=UPI0009B9A530|nr:septum site-determining protein MinD [bacterium endosymbiont of Pedicinus badii]OQM34415.1 septum site-determining protein MinD [bacterium endosymbiont of Pedicinus badii]
MTKIIVVTSGKGGVGKTTSSASIAMGLAKIGYKTAVIDFDIGLRNLDLIMGCERRVVYDFIDVIRGNANLSQALIKDKRSTNLFILPASQTKDKDSLNKVGIKKIFDELAKKNFRFIICDSPAGIELGFLMALYYADEAIIVTNPEISSVRDADRILGIIASKSYKSENNLNPIREHLLINRYNANLVSKGDMMSTKDIMEILGIPIIGIIPEDKLVLKSSNIGKPVILQKNSIAGKEYYNTVLRLLGRKIEFPFLKKKFGFFRRIFRRI